MGEGGRLYQLRRGLYAVAPPFQRVRPHPFLVANRLVPGSYLSLQSALGHFALIPESVPVTTSVTTGRPGRWTTPLGTYDFRHIQPEFLNGFQRMLLMGGQEALLATPKPPTGAIFATTIVRRTITLNLRHHNRVSLFAGKLRAILQPLYPKGRDLYDLIWCVSDPMWPLPNFVLPNRALAQTGWTGSLLNDSSWKGAVLERLRSIDW